MKKLFSLVVFALIVQSQAFAGPSVTAGTGNPAAVNCGKLGGKVESVKFPGGKSSVCRFGSAVIEAWLLNSTVQYHQPSDAITAFFKNTENKFAGKAEGFCQALGGNVIQTQRIEFAGTFNLCEFEDGSMLEVKTLFAGPRAPGNAQLVKVLTK